MSVKNRTGVASIISLQLAVNDKPFYNVLYMTSLRVTFRNIITDLRRAMYNQIIAVERLTFSETNVH